MALAVSFFTVVTFFFTATLLTVTFLTVTCLTVVAFFKDSDDDEDGTGDKVDVDESTRRTWSMKSRDDQIDAEK